MSEIRTRVRTSHHLGDSETSIAAGVGPAWCLVRRVTRLSPHPSTCSIEPQPHQGCLGLQQASLFLVRLAVAAS